MIKTVKQACRFNPIIRDYRMSQGIENLADLINDAGDGSEFFSRNFVTHGMDQLFREGLLRLSGKSDQAVFELTQAMGGGKTHMMIALGLLARHPNLRKEVLSADLTSRIEFGHARIAAFNGRNNPDNFIWGEIATQLGAAEAIKPYWANGPKAVDQRQWKEIIGDQPTLILLDELPPYLDNASTQVFGQGTLANMAVYSLSSLMSAALELPNCAIVVANLSGSYKAQTKALADAISNLQQETRRQAMTITPVQLAGNEIYEILKKRLIDELPDERVVSDIAEEYAQQIKKAEDGGYIVASSIERRRQVGGIARPTGGDDRHTDRSRGGAEQLEIVAGARAVAVDRGEQPLAGTAFDPFDDPGERVAAGRRATAMGHHLPTVAAAPRIDREHDEL